MHQPPPHPCFCVLHLAFSLRGGLVNSSEHRDVVCNLLNSRLLFQLPSSLSHKLLDTHHMPGDTHTHAHAHAHTPTQTHLLTHMFIHTHTHTHMQVHTHIKKHTYIYTHTLIHTNTHTQTQRYTQAIYHSKSGAGRFY